MMTYHCAQFLLFLAVFLVIYRLVPGKLPKQLVLLGGNLYFYSKAGGITMLVFLFMTSLVVQLCGWNINRIYSHYDSVKENYDKKEARELWSRYKKKAKIYLVAALLLIVGCLVIVKAGKLNGWRHIIVPLGISYYTFSSVGYLLDIFWRKTEFEPDYFKLLLCMTYFPHIVQGPISRYPKLIKQMEELPDFSYERVCFGLQRVCWGLFKKLVIADRIALFTACVFREPEGFAGLQIAFAVFLAVIEIYADFSGCMDMVIGISEAIGITLEENFRQPFFAKSAAEFWRRWHITLNTWFKDYIFFPIAVNPKFLKWTAGIRKEKGQRIASAVSSLVPLTAVWILTGLWHGTGSHYLIWGLYWLALTGIETVFAPEFKKINKKLGWDQDRFGCNLFRMIRTFFYFAAGRMIVVTGSVSGFLTLVRQLFKEWRLWTFFDGTMLTYGLERGDYAVLFMGIIMMWAVSMLQQHNKIRQSLAMQPMLIRWPVYISAVVLIVVFGLYGPAFDASSFIYGGF